MGETQWERRRGRHSVRRLHLLLTQQVSPTPVPQTVRGAHTGGTEPGGRDASGNVPEGGIVPQPRVLCMRYVVTGMVDEGLHMDRLLRECIDAFRGATALPLLTKPHA